MANENLEPKKIYEGLLTLFYTLTIGVLSGTGWLFIEIAVLNNPVLEGLLWSYLIGTGISAVHLITSLSSLGRKYKLEELEEDSTSEKCEKMKEQVAN